LKLAYAKRLLAHLVVAKESTKTRIETNRNPLRGSRYLPRSLRNKISSFGKAFLLKKRFVAKVVYENKD
jgi:hypothetical protein